MILFDTSVWIDGLNGNNTKEVRYLKRSIVENQVAITSTIIQEVLQGIKSDEQFKKVSDNFKGFLFLKINPQKAAIGAAQLYRKLRRKGVSIRKPNDCLIAYTAIYYNLKVVHNDIDFIFLAEHTELKVQREKP